MSAQPEQPLHSHRRKLGILDYAIAILLVWFVATAVTRGDQIWLLFMIAIALLILYTTQWRYDLYPDRLVIRCLALRRTTVRYDAVADAGTVRMAMIGSGVLVVMHSGRRMLLRPVDQGAFVEQLGALVGARRKEQEEEG
ncbi:MAG: hypothetical protein J4F32_06405 [Dehalococcoidia bacterium]|nr:hypothetical protein [Dehalococcoidia bacterium]